MSGTQTSIILVVLHSNNTAKEMITAVNQNWWSVKQKLLAIFAYLYMTQGLFNQFSQQGRCKNSIHWLFFLRIDTSQ